MLLPSMRSGLRAAVPVIVPTIALGASFGILARPVLGGVAAVAMSVFVFSGGAQFAALSVLQGGGTALAAIAAGLLVNARWVPMSLAIAPSLTGGRARRALQAQAIVDASFVIADRGDGSFDRHRLLGATLPQAASWTTGTVIGVLASSTITDPQALGLDAIFPAFYLTLLLQETTDRRPVAVIVVAAVIAVSLLPFAPPGIPVIAASGAALLGLRRA